VQNVARTNLQECAAQMTDSHHDDQQQGPLPSLWPLGFAIGVACLLVGLVVSLTAVIVGAVIAVVFGLLWVKELKDWGGAVAHAEAKAKAAPEPHIETYDRNTFLSAATLGVGGIIGAGVTLPSIGFGILPSFIGDEVETRKVDLGPLENFPQGRFVIATYMELPEQGEVTRRTAYIRNNGFTEDGQPSFTTIFSRCVHLGCPVQPSGLLFEEEKTTYKDVELIPTEPAGFGCPCHGGSYDNEGNRVAGPPVRALDRYEFSIENGNLFVGKLYSVGSVAGTGANAKIKKYRRQYPGTPVDGWESWLYPIPTPGS
jgi:menaquinol-cytochrome c reductase iron-sulfur subunit